MFKKSVPEEAPTSAPASQAEPSSEAPAQTDISVVDIVRAVLTGWWIVILCVALAIGYGLYTIRGATPVYTAQALILPTDRPTVGGNSGGGGLGAVLNLAVGGGADQFGRFADMLQSYSLALRLNQKYDLLKVLYKSQWDEANQTWITPPPRRFEALRDWIGLPRPLPPSLMRLQDFLGSKIEFGASVGGSLGRPSEVTAVTFDYPDPQFAKWFLETAIREADQLLREGERERAQARIKYIEQQLAATTTDVSRQVLIALLEEQYQKLTVASASSAYYVEMFDPVSVSEQPTYPRPVFVIQLSIVIGLALGVFAALIFRFRHLAFGRKAREIAFYKS